VLLAAMVLWSGCGRRQDRHLVVAEATHFLVQGEGDALNFPLFPGTLGVDEIERDLSLADYYYRKLSSVYNFRSFNFVGTSGLEHLLERDGLLDQPLPVYTYDDSVSRVDIALTCFTATAAQFTFQAAEKSSGLKRTHEVEVPAGKSASVGALYDQENNRGHLVSLSWHSLTLTRQLQPADLAGFLQRKNAAPGTPEPARFKPGDQRWMDQIFGPGVMTLAVADSSSPSGDTGEVNLQFDVPPVPEGGMEAIARAVKYPASALADSVAGTVMVQTTIQRDGSVSSCRVIRGVRADVDSAAVTALRSARFKPAQYQGQAVKVTVVIPIQFNPK